MESCLELLQEAAIFMVASSVILHFFPGSSYERYGKLMVTLAVLSMLVVPVMEIFQKDLEDIFWDEADRLEAENEIFAGKLADFLADGTDAVERGLMLSVEEKISGAAKEAGVSVWDVYLDGETVVIEVQTEGTAGVQAKEAADIQAENAEGMQAKAADLQTGTGAASGEADGMKANSVSPVRIDRVEVPPVKTGTSEEKTVAKEATGEVPAEESPVEEEPVEKGSAEDTLAGLFAAKLGLEEGRVKVIER